MKRFLLFLTCLGLLISLVACGGKNQEQETTEAMIETSIEPTTEIPTEAPTETESIITETTIDANEEVEATLYKVFDFEGFSTIVTVEDHEATVILDSNDIADVFSKASAGDEQTIKDWDEIVALFLDIHNNARGIIANYGEYSLTTIVVSNSIPYISMKDGEVTVDMLHLGE